MLPSSQVGGVEKFQNLLVWRFIFKVDLVGCCGVVFSDFVVVVCFFGFVFTRFSYGTLETLIAASDLDESRGITPKIFPDCTFSFSSLSSFKQNILKTTGGFKHL